MAFSSAQPIPIKQSDHQISSVLVGVAPKPNNEITTEVESRQPAKKSIIEPILDSLEKPKKSKQLKKPPKKNIPKQKPVSSSRVSKNSVVLPKESTSFSRPRKAHTRVRLFLIYFFE